MTTETLIERVVKEAAIWEPSPLTKLLGQVSEALIAASVLEQKSERVFQAVVYAFEGREVPDDLCEHGMVRRAVKYRANAELQCAALREALEELLECNRGVWSHSDQGRAYIAKIQRVLSYASSEAK